MELSSGIILDPVTQFDSSRDKRLDWKKVLFSGEVVAGNYPPNEWSWAHREGAGTWYIPKQVTHSGKGEPGDQRKFQMKEIKGRKERKSIRTGEVPVQGKKSSVSMVKRKSI